LESLHAISRRPSAYICHTTGPLLAVDVMG
jgi:hypothetical protein